MLRDNAAIVASMVPHETVVKRGIEGATMFAVTKLLNDGRVSPASTTRNYLPGATAERMLNRKLGSQGFCRKWLNPAAREMMMSVIFP